MEYWLIVLTIVIGALSSSYLFKNFNYFKRHGVIHIPPVPIIGSMGPIIFRQMSFVDAIQRIYNFNREAKYIGLYATTRPVFLLRDLELIKDISIKNFNSFMNRPVFSDFDGFLLSQNMFFLKGSKWYDVKHLLSPSFTTSKMKIMFTSISRHAADVAKFMSRLPADKSDVNIKDIFDRYTNDVIASCSYGIKIDSIRDPTNKFYTSGKDITHMSAIRTIKYIFVRSFPKLGRIFNIKLLNNQAMKYFETSIKNEIAFRDAEGITRSDMIQLMMNNRGKEGRIQLDVNDMVAHAYAFYFGGFETSSSVMSFTAHNIVANPKVQIKLRQEIDNLLNELNGDVTYEAINQLEYLDALVKESLRLFSPSVVERVCNRAYELPPALPGEKSFIIEEGMMIWIPIHAIHHDEKYYDNPNEFRPERFLDDNHGSTFYSPFGLGPKTCIGKRFGILMVKIVLFYLLARCELKLCAKTASIQFSKKNLIMMPENGFWLNVQRRDDIHPALRGTI